MGVELADGTQIRSRLVVSNINAKTLYLEMIGRDNMPGWAARAIDSYEVSIPCPMIMLGMDTAPGPGRAPHHLLRHHGRDEQHLVRRYFKKGKLHSGG